MQVFIGISGLIGAGKTTLATALGKTLDLPAYFEPVVSNDYLAGSSLLLFVNSFDFRDF
jgi:deoxyadenosine/deoxycytidine kinase